MVEEIEKSATTDNLSLNGDNDASRKDDTELGQITDHEDSSLAPLPSRPVMVQSNHPLEHSWTLWFDNPTGKTKQSTWGSSIRFIYTFSTVEEFWGVRYVRSRFTRRFLFPCFRGSKWNYVWKDCLYNNIHHPSKLGIGSDFYCFKDNIEPKWEDPVCANGGKWTMTFVRGKSDTAWLYTLLALIGEQFDHGDEICGAVVNIRPKDKISIWTKDGFNESAQMSIGEQWKKFVVCNDHIGFILHDDAKKDSRSAKNLYTVT